MADDTIADVVMAAATFFSRFSKTRSRKNNIGVLHGGIVKALLGAQRHSCLHFVALHFKIINASRSVSHSHIDTMV